MACRISSSVGSGLRDEQVDRGHDHAGGAEPALETVLLPEGGLHRVEVVAVGEALDGLDLRAVGLDREHRAGLDGLAIDVDRAGAALAGVAADVRAGQVEILPQGLDEESPRLDVELPGRPIDDERDVFAHGHEPPAARVGRRSRSLGVFLGPSEPHPPADPHVAGRALMVAPHRRGIKSARHPGPGRGTAADRRDRAPRSGC